MVTKVWHEPWTMLHSETALKLRHHCSYVNGQHASQHLPCLRWAPFHTSNVPQSHGRRESGTKTPIVQAHRVRCTASAGLAKWHLETDDSLDLLHCLRLPLSYFKSWWMQQPKVQLSKPRNSRNYQPWIFPVGPLARLLTKKQGWVCCGQHPRWLCLGHGRQPAHAGAVKVWNSTIPWAGIRVLDIGFDFMKTSISRHRQ